MGINKEPGTGGDVTYYLKNYRSNRHEMLLSRAWRKAFFRVSYFADFKAGDVFSLHEEYFYCPKSRKGKNCRLVYYWRMDDPLEITAKIGELRKGLTK